LLYSSFTPCLVSHTLLCQALRNLQIAFGPLLDGHTLEEVTLWADEIYEESDINLTKGSPLKTKTDSLTNTTLGLVVLDDIVEVVLPGTCVCVCVCARARNMYRLTDRHVFDMSQSSFDMYVILLQVVLHSKQASKGVIVSLL
jgi:hypothetical protein